MIVPTPLPIVRADLSLIGLRLDKRTDGCACEVCRYLDGEHDTDLFATDVSNSVLRSMGMPKGALYPVSYRRQDEYDYRTITIRVSNDTGNDEVQEAKIIGRRSLALIVLQSYPSGVAWAQMIDVRAALQRAGCKAHDAPLSGADSQRFRVLCQRCCAMHYVSRVQEAVA